MLDEGSGSPLSSTTQDKTHRDWELSSRVDRILGTRAFPASTLKLARLTRDPVGLMDEIVHVLETDPVLSTRLLRVVNSAGFALRNKCTSVRHAAVLVGNSRLNEIATAGAIIDMYQGSATHAACVLEHSAVAATLCRLLAYHFQLPTDELFTCGFLHDIGKLMLIETDGMIYEKLLDQAGPLANAMHDAEALSFGFDHAGLAGQVLVNWNLPEPVPQVVRWHHDLESALAVSEDIGRRVAVVQLADLMSYSFRRHESKAQAIGAWLDSAAARHLELEAAECDVLWKPAESLAESARRMSRDRTGLEETFSLRPGPPPSKSRRE